MQLLAPRKLDKSTLGFIDWTFMSVMTWGEEVEGTWVVKIIDNVSIKCPLYKINFIIMVFYLGGSGR